MGVGEKGWLPGVGGIKVLEEKGEEEKEKMLSYIG